MHRGRWLLLAGMLVAGSACARNPATQAPPADSTVRVLVTNERGAAVTVEALVAGATRRLGVVDVAMTVGFVLPSELIGRGAVEFRARGAGGEVRSGQVTVSPGQTVEFRVGTSQVSSSVWVRP